MEEFYLKYSVKIAQFSMPHGQCRFWTKALSKDGYGVVKYKHPVTGWHTTHAHRLAYMVDSRSDNLAGLHVSHLCHNQLCVNPQHLSAEAAAINADRVRCVNRNDCSTHGPHPPCLLQYKC